MMRPQRFVAPYFVLRELILRQDLPARGLTRVKRMFRPASADSFLRTPHFDPALLISYSAVVRSTFMESGWNARMFSSCQNYDWCTMNPVAIHLASSCVTAAIYI